MIASRPAEVEGHAVPGHSEGDLLIGLIRSSIGKLVERSSCCMMLAHLPREKGLGQISHTIAGPALAGYGAVAMVNALKKTVTELPVELWRSLTRERGVGSCPLDYRAWREGVLRRPAKRMAALNE